MFWLILFYLKTNVLWLLALYGPLLKKFPKDTKVFYFNLFGNAL